MRTPVDMGRKTSVCFCILKFWQNSLSLPLTRLTDYSVEIFCFCRPTDQSVRNMFAWNFHFFKYCDNYNVRNIEVEMWSFHANVFLTNSSVFCTGTTYLQQNNLQCVKHGCGVLFCGTPTPTPSYSRTPTPEVVWLRQRTERTMQTDKCSRFKK